MSDSYEPARDDLDEYLDLLRRYTHRLRRLGVYALLSLLAHLVACAVTPVLADNIRDWDDGVMMGWVLLPISTGIASLTAVFLFDAVKRRLEVLFEEVSDEIQWFIRRSDRHEVGDSTARPQMRSRLAVRDAARVQELPMIPGRYGPALYSLVALVAMFVSILLVTQLS